MSASSCDEAERLIESATSAGEIPAAQLAVISGGRLVHSSAHGADHLGRAVSDEALFDLASVTKVAATTLATAAAATRGELRLDDPVGRFLNACPALGRVTLAELLAHTSGLPAWTPLFELSRRDPLARSIYPGLGERTAEAFEWSRALIVDALLQTAPGASRGERSYSDLGFIVLGLVLEAIGRAPLDRLCREEVFEPLGLEGELGYRSLTGALPRPGGEGQILATGLSRPREPAPGQEVQYQVHEQPPRPDPGEVDDDNAYALGGVAGQAGLFGTARALAALGWAIHEELDGAARLGAGATLARFVLPSPARAGARRGLGFDLPADEGSAAGRLIGKAGPRGAVGHLGFTGCSLWLDLDRGLSIALLTNRTLRGRSHVEAVRSLRPAVHDAVAALTDRGRPSAS